MGSFDLRASKISLMNPFEPKKLHLRNEPHLSPMCHFELLWGTKNLCFRVCLDSRKLNSATKHFIARFLERLPATKYLTALDWSDAFWQVEFEMVSKENLILSFGLVNAAQTLSKVIEKVYLSILSVAHLELFEKEERLETANLTGWDGYVASVVNYPTSVKGIRSSVRMTSLVYEIYKQLLITERSDYWAYQK